ncbi:MAG TPA: SurA N-terminal domain-containing protein, partial [Patescibacteria group bacterium]
KSAAKQSPKIKKVSPILEQQPVAQPISSSPTMDFKQKIKNPKYFIPAIIIVLAILAYAFKGQFITAIVNGQPITRAQYISALEAKDGKTVLDSLVVETLINQEAAKKGVTISQKELDADTKQIQDNLTKQGQNLDQLLAAQGMTRADFQTQLKTQKLIEKLLGNNITITDQEIQNYIDQNKDSLPQGISDADLKNQVKQQLFQQKLGEKAQAWIQDLQQKAKITYF